MTRVKLVDGCDDSTAWEQLRSALNDGKLKARFPGRDSRIVPSRWDQAQIDRDGNVLFHDPLRFPIYAAGQKIGSRPPEIWCRVEVGRDWVEKLWLIAKPKPSNTIMTSAGTKTSVEKQLTDLMRAGPKQKSKEKYREEMNIGKRPFDDAWRRAQEAVGDNLHRSWYSPGRPRKS